MADLTWIQDLVNVLTKALENDGKITFNKPTGEQVKIQVTDDVLALIKQNRHRLVQIGKETFEEYLKMKSDGLEFDALVLIYDRLDTVELVEKAKENAIRLQEIALQLQMTRKFWVEFGKKVGMKLATGLLGLILA